MIILHQMINEDQRFNWFRKVIRIKIEFNKLKENFRRENVLEAKCVCNKRGFDK